MVKPKQKSLLNLNLPPVSTDATARSLPTDNSQATGPALSLVQSGHPGQRDPFFIPAGATPEQVQFWTDMHFRFSVWPEPETAEDLEGTAWLSIIDRAGGLDTPLGDALRTLRRWGCRLNWTPRGNLRLNWRPALANVPEMECSTAHRMEVLSRNQAALIGVPEEHHGRLVTLLDRYLEPFRDELGRVFRETAAVWPEDARW